MRAAGPGLDASALPLQSTELTKPSEFGTALRSSVRSKVEHVFAVMKLQFGFTKVRYRGLAKNANRLFATCALVNLFMIRKKLLYKDRKIR